MEKDVRHSFDQGCGFVLGHHHSQDHRAAASLTRPRATGSRALARTPQPPSLWANASTGTIYRDARDRPMDEKNGELGKGFSVAVARAWGHELFAAPTPVRKVALRMSIVLGAGGGAIL